MYRDHSLDVTVPRKGALKGALNEQLLLKARAHYVSHTMIGTN